MVRKIIKINEELCNGCSLCVNACHEGAIGLVNGKAKLLRDDYCDGLGNCLPVCPTGAISFEEREADPFNEDAVMANTAIHESELGQWPVQIKLVAPNAAFFQGSHLLIAADCTAYAYANFHQQFMKDKITLIGCPKLDEGNYAEKLRTIFESNDIRSITVVRMEVPCCGGIVYAVQEALRASGKNIPSNVMTVSIQGQLI